MSGPQSSTHIRSRVNAFERNSRIINIPLGRQLTCCDAANFFESYVLNLTRDSQAVIDFLSGFFTDPFALSPVSLAINNVLDTSRREFARYAKGCCDSSCCVEATRTIALVSNFILINLVLLAGAFAEELIDITTVNSIIAISLSLYDKLVRFVVKISCDKSNKQKANNIIIDSTILAPPTIPAANSLNIDKCCEAVISAIGEAYRRIFAFPSFLSPTTLVTVAQTVEILNDVFLAALERLLCCCNCCIGTSEALLNLFISAVDRIIFVVNETTVISSDITIDNFRQDTATLLRNACKQ